MKRILYSIFVMLLCMICFTACGKGKDSAPSNSETHSETQPEKQISFVHNEIILNVGDSVQAEVETLHANVYIAWSIRDPEVATVKNGVITGVSEGQTICYAKFGGDTAMCLVKVMPKTATPMLSVSVPYKNNEITLYKGDTLGLNVHVKLGDSVLDNATISYEVDNTSIAHVEEGSVVGDEVGSATVVITVTYEGKTATLSLTVNVVEK